MVARHGRISDRRTCVLRVCVSGSRRVRFCTDWTARRFLSSGYARVDSAVRGSARLTRSRHDDHGVLAEYVRCRGQTQRMGYGRFACVERPGTRFASIVGASAKREMKMPERETIERAHEDAREGKSPSTQGGEFVREEIHHVREGKHGARSTKQAIAIGLSKARRAGIKVPVKKGTPARTRTQAKRDLAAGRKRGRKVSAKRSKAVRGALRREGHAAASHTALARQARASARKRSASARSAAAKKAVRTKGAAGRSAAAKKAARTRARHG
jgi:hypothetical protein